MLCLTRGGTLKSPALRSACRISATYAAAALAYILVSNVLVRALVRDPDMIAVVTTLKGWAFVGVTAGLLCRTLARQFQRSERAHAALKELLRAHRMSEACDGAMIRARRRDELFGALCRIAVEEGGYALAWVGLAADDEEKSVVPAARAGDDGGYVDSIQAVWADAERGRGPTGTAIRTGRASACRFTVDDPDFAPWREAARARGFASCLSLPLRQDGRATGVLALYSRRPDAFDAAETALLERLSVSISYALDNLAREEKERAQMEELRRLSHAVDASPASIVITDAGGTITFVNRKFADVSGYAPEEVLGRNVRVLKSGETSPEEYRRLWATITAGREWHGEFLNRKKNGEVFQESASISPVLDEDGRITHYIAVKEDVTERRSLERQLRQAQKMEAVGTLAGGIAHDFNNILTVIQGHCTLLAAAGAPPSAPDSLAEIQAAAERAANLTRQLLAFGRKQVLNMRPVDLAEAAGRTCRMLKRLIPESIVLEQRLPRLPLRAVADPGMIEQVLMNLVVNARDALPHGGRIVVEAAEEPAALAPPPGVPLSADGWVRVSVSDNGYGVPPAILPHVFEPFVTTKAPGQGSGLGLATVHGIVQQHKGWATVESAVGRGATFRVFLPRAPRAEPAEPEPPAAAPRGGDERVLLVEDEPSLRRLSARFLARLGYDVVEAADGPAAFEAWERGGRHVRLLITDLVMPGGLGGDELARLLRERDPGLRVLLVSGYHPAFTGGGPELARGVAFLPKPFTPEELARAARNVLDAA